MQRLRRFHPYRLVHREPDAEADHTRHQQVGSSEGDRETPPGIRQTDGIEHIEIQHIQDKNQHQRDSQHQQHQSLAIHQTTNPATVGTQSHTKPNLTLPCLRA